MPLHDYREDTEGTVDTWEILDQQRADAPGNFVVPPGAHAITGLEFLVGWDPGAAAAIVRLVTALRIQGAALLTEHKPFYFVGPAGMLTVTTLGAFAMHSPRVRYPVNIPVREGLEWEAAFKFMGEDPIDVHGFLNVEYDGIVSTPPLLGAEVREDDLADTTETLVTIDTDVAEGTAVQNFFPPAGASRIFAVDVAVGLDVAGATRFGHQIELDGNGLNVQQKPQRWCAWAGAQALVGADGAAGFISPPERRIVDLPVIVGRNTPIIARAGMIEEDYGAGTMAVGLLYV